MSKKRSKLFIIMMMIIFYTSSVYAFSIKGIEISGKNEVEIGKNIQLKAEEILGNDIWLIEDPLPSETRSDITDTCTWESNNPEIATVDENGKVTGVSEGKAIITATISSPEMSATYEINVKKESVSDLYFMRRTPEPIAKLNETFGLTVILENIPTTEKENIEISIDNDNVAKLNNIDLCNDNDMITITLDLISLGEANVTASLNYNGKKYEDTYKIVVIESKYTIKLLTR